MDLEGLAEEVRRAVPADEGACVRRLIALRWGTRGFCCPTCGWRRWTPVRSRPRVRSCAGCGRQTSVTSGTLLHRTRVDLRVWFLAAALLMREEGCQARELAARADVHLQTAWRILHRLRTGAAESQLLLRGAVEHGSVPVTLRRPCRPNVATARVQVVADGSGACVAAADTDPDPLIARHAPHVAPEVPSEARRRGTRRVWTELRTTHQWVSERWLGRYLAGIAFKVGHAGAPPEIWLRCALTAKRRTFEELAPPLPAHWLRVRQRRALGTRRPRAYGWR